MDKRYQHPMVTELWGPVWTYGMWWRIERETARAQANLRIIDQHEAHALTTEFQPPFDAVVGRIQEIEATTKHDVAAFLQYMREWWGEPHARWIHYGLTSSDLVDTAQAARFRLLMVPLSTCWDGLREAIDPWIINNTPVLGRTHGQPAEPTAIRMRAMHWWSPMRVAYRNLVAATRDMRVMKLSGPVGTFAHNPPEIEGAVALALRLDAQGTGASQIVPRYALAHWANAASEFVRCCSKVAIDLRLMNLLGEVRMPQAAGQVGSSSMAHKVNPIQAEQIGGLARLAAGYASMLQSMDLWLERDISHSCVERVAVPDLWHVLLHTMKQTTELLNHSELVLFKIQDNLELNANAAYVSRTTYAGIRDGMSWEEAREYGEDIDVEEYDLPGAVQRDFLSNYPQPRGI